MPGDRFITLDRQRRLRFDLNALAHIEELTGPPLGKELTIGAKNVRIILWAGLVHEDPTLTIGEVGAMVDSGEKYHDAVQMVATALAEAFGEPSGNPQTAAAGGTGTLSAERPSAPSS